VTGPSLRPDLARLPLRPTTRFAPAPTGELHLGHLVNILYVWGVGRATGGRVQLRIEDHDRQRARPAFEAAILDDLEALGIAPDDPSIGSLRAGPSDFRQSDCGAVYAGVLDGLLARGLAYACDCARSTFAASHQATGAPWHGPGCPGACRERGLPLTDRAGIRVALGTGVETWVDALCGPSSGEPSRDGDLLVRDRHGNWTYAFCVVVDDLRHGVDLVIRGRDLLDATPAQIRLARLIGRAEPATFLHHPLIRKPGGAKLSKADRDTSIRSRLDAGRTPGRLLGDAAAAIGLADGTPIDDAAALFT
jgi:glutamyl-tRNA synthetase/glutamyl-Q tRNA(Asp) synthetase